MRKRIIGAICVVIGTIGVMTMDILDTAGLMSKRWMYILKGGYQYYELFLKTEFPKSNNKEHRPPINKFIINEFNRIGSLYWILY